VKNLLKALLYATVLIAASGSFASLALGGGDAADSTIAEPPAACVTIAAVGDLLMHLPIGDSVFVRETNSYAFDRVFAPIAPYLSWCDYSVANLETRIAGTHIAYRGYPRFNTPADLAGHLGDAGFDLMATANNHCLDWGWAGIVNTLNAVDSAGLQRVGTYGDPEEKREPFLVDLYGIRIAFLNYTSSTNGLTIQPEYRFAYNMLDFEVAATEAALARENGADLVIAIVHFGEEYQRTVSPSQRDAAQRLCEAGVDVIIGSHPHVVQPIEKIVVERDGELVECVVAWSLGNFVSCQREMYRDSGIILYLEIEKIGARTTVCGVSYLPVWVQQGRTDGGTRYRILPVHEDIPPESDVPLTERDLARMREVWEELNALLMDRENGILPWDCDMLGQYPAHNWHL